MQIVTDSGFDLTAEELALIDVHVVPHTITLAGKTYLNGVDIDSSQLYKLLDETKAYPTTSQPAPGDFVKVYQEVAKNDHNILSVHMSSGLSGTLNSVEAAFKEVNNPDITIFDTLTLSFAMGWLVMSAHLARQAGWDKPRIIAYLRKIAEAANTIYTLSDLQYLIHGGRISHIRGLLANALNIKPMICVDKITGKYEQIGRARTFKRAIAGLVDQIKQHHPEGSELVVQVGHADNLEGAQELKELINQSYDCTWRPMGRLSPVLGAHTGPSMVGVAYAPKFVFELPLPKV